jgi:hypothetical protein
MTMSDTAAKIARVPATGQEWCAWLDQELAKTEAAYRDKPSLLIADYHRERAITRDYEGREILELLQNANDQATEAGLRGRVVIELWPEGLVVANTGMPFSTGGVASLQTSHLSPKRRRKRQVIGNKGLGFRSVLNWSNSPIILSGALRLFFSQNRVRQRLQVLMTASEELAALVQDERQGRDESVAPLLSFPAYLAGGDLSTAFLLDGERSILSRCDALIGQGYTTAIGMPFDQPGAHEAAKAQLHELRPEILLFTKHLEEIHFSEGGAPGQTWRLYGDDALARVESKGDTLGEWRVFRTGGTLPEDAREPDQGETPEFEIVVAVPTNAGARTAPLFSHFPTDITLPLSVVCHATLELEQNRKHVQQERKSNAFVLHRLAEFLAETAEALAAMQTDDLWQGCSVLMQSGSFPSDLERVSFGKHMLACACQRRIVPTLSGALVRAAEARLVSGASQNWLPVTLFDNVVPLRSSDDLRFLEALEVPRFDVASIKRQIVQHTELLTEQRVALIDGLVRHHVPPGAHTSALFLDAEGMALGDDLRVFLAPASGQVPTLPKWMDLWFLNDEMRAKLAARLGTRDNRELQGKLTTFGLVEYSLANVVSAIVAATNRAVKSDPQRESEFESGLLRTVFELYRGDGAITKRPDYPDKSPIRMQNQAGQFVSAHALYLGRGFGAHGEITQALFERWAPEQLIAQPDDLGLTEDSDLLRSFLLWIGVAAWPRDGVEENPDREFLDYVLGRITFPARFQDYLFDSRQRVERPSVKKVRTVDGLNEILSRSDHQAVTAWLALDERAVGWQRWSSQHAELCSRPGQTWSDRSFAGPVPSYVKWVIESTAWLLSPSDAKLRPKDCLLGERAIEALFPRPRMPRPDELTRYGIRPPDVVEGWRRAGVLTGLAYLERDDIYAKLLELPKRSPDGKMARPLYQWLLDANDMAIGEAGGNCGEFLARGKMWGRHAGEERYFPVSDLHHADAEGLPDVLLRRLKIVDLRKRVGADKVERIFGVKPVDRAGVRQSVKRYQTAVGSVAANSDFQAAKPFLYKLRSSQTSQVTNLQALKDIRLEVCSVLTACISYETESFEYDVSVWGWVIDEKVLYVRSDPADPLSPSADLLADAIGEALASVFRIGDGGEFARMLLCQDKDRQQLLRKMRGETIVEDIESIKAEFAAFQVQSPMEARFPIVPPPQVRDSLPELIASPAQAHDDSPEHPKLPSSTELTPAGPLQITEEETMVSPPPGKQKLRIKSVSTTPTTTSSTRRVTDGDFCERKAMEFEESDDPPRFPLLVSQTMGSEGSWCDIVSFATAEAREAFRVSPTRDLGSVVRFIEVKGRSNATATIELKGNELVAAESYGERYYLYRLFEEDKGGFGLTVLQNPLKHKDALQPAVYVRLEGATARQQFTLEGGIQKSKNS